MKCVNLGCGSSFHPDWINFDVISTGPGVIPHDLTRGIPLSEASCDVVYHSHVIEHLRRSDALPFMQECYRILKPGGVLRVAVPDLEQICQVYLEKLDEVCTNPAAAKHDYEWTLLELYDQTVREQSGGGMLAYLQQDPLPNEGFIYERIGEEGRVLLEHLRSQKTSTSASRWVYNRPLSTLARRLLRRLRVMLTRLLVLASGGRHGLRAYELGRFRLGGEVHHWMYDRYSLAELMMTVGFESPVRQSATTSRVPGWVGLNLDTLPDGTVRKPDSLFMEAIKPA